MARKPMPALPPAAEDINHDAIAADNQNAREISVADMAVLDSAELFKCIGRIEAAHFAETVSAKLIAQSYLKAKDQLGRLGEVLVEFPDGSRKHVSAIEDFCDAVMPVSARRCRQIVAAIDVLGNDLYDQAERIGFRARDYQALKALPLEDQELIKQAIGTDSRESVLDLLAELAGRNKKLRDKETQLVQLVEARDEQIAAKDEHIEKLLLRKRFKPTADSIAQNEAELALLEELHSAAHSIEPLMRRLSNVLTSLGTNPGVAMKKRCNQVAELLAAHLADLVDTHALTVNLSAAMDLRPDWLKTTSLGAAVEEAVEKVEQEKAAKAASKR